MRSRDRHQNPPGKDEANPQDRILASSRYFSVTSMSRSAIVTRTPGAPLISAS